MFVCVLLYSQIWQQPQHMPLPALTLIRLPGGRERGDALPSRKRSCWNHRKRLYTTMKIRTDAGMLALYHDANYHWHVTDCEIEFLI